MPDYQTDYTKYSLAELREALAGIDGDSYPENKAALEAELERRKRSGEYDRELDRQAAELANREADRRRLALTLRPWLAYYLIGTAPLVWVMTSAYTGPGWVQALKVFVLLFAAASITAGIGILRGKQWGHWLAVGVLVPQVVSLQLPTLFVGISSALALSVGADAAVNLSFGAAFSPGLKLLSGQLALPVGISVNLFALACLWVLFKAQSAESEAELK